MSATTAWVGVTDAADGVEVRGDLLDDELLRVIYEEHAASLLWYVIGLTGDRLLAEDVVQETMLRVWRHPEASAPSRGPLRPWLITVARNIVIDKARARKARPAEVGEAHLVIASVDDGLDAILVASDVADALGRLTASHREAVLEMYFRGRSVVEAAEILRVPVGTVKSRTYYALRALRLALEETGATP